MLLSGWNDAWAWTRNCDTVAKGGHRILNTLFPLSASAFFFLFYRHLHLISSVFLCPDASRLHREAANVTKL